MIDIDEMYDNYKTKTKGAEAFSLIHRKTLPESTIVEDIASMVYKIIINIFI